MPEGEISIGIWSLHLDDLRLDHGTRQRRLNPQDLSVLLHLVEAAPGMVGIEALLARCWPDTVVSDGAVYQSVCRLRRALDQHDGSHRYIETLPKRGYRLVAPVQIACPLDRLRRRAPGRAGPSRRSQPPRPSVAILPLSVAGERSVSGSRQDPLALGLAQDLATGLCATGRFDVASPAAVLALDGSGAAGMADSLGVRYLLDGGLRHCGARVRVSLQLVDTWNGCFVVWADRFTERMGDLFKLQDAICARAIAALVARLDRHLERPHPGPPARTR